MYLSKYLYWSYTEVTSTERLSFKMFYFFKYLKTNKKLAKPNRHVCREPPLITKVMNRYFKFQVQEVFF